MLLRIGIGDALHVRARVVGIEDAVAVAVASLLLLGSERHHEHAAEVGRTDAARQARTGAGADLEIVDDAVADAAENLGVRVALLHVAQRHAAVRFDTELQVAIVEQEDARTGAPGQRGAGAHAAERVARPELGARGGGVDEAIRDAATDDELGQAANLAVAHERTRAVRAGGHPDVATDRDLEGIVVLAEESDTQPETEIADLGLARRHERGAAGGRGAVAVLVQGDRQVDVDVDPIEQREAAVQVHEELIRHDLARAIAGPIPAQDERVVRVVAEKHEVRRCLPRRVGGLDTEEAVARRRRLEAVKRDRGLLRRRFLRRCCEREGGGGADEAAGQ